LALDAREEHHAWNRYISGVPEDLNSRFVTEGTDPRTLILRVLATGRKASVKGVPREDIIDFLEDSFGAFQQKQARANWAWDRSQLADSLTNLANHKLIEVADGDCYHLSELGRFAGEGGIEVESIVRLVEALSPLRAASINDPTFLAASQVTVELDQSYMPFNKKDSNKEQQAWFAELRRQGGVLQVSRTVQCLISGPIVGLQIRSASRSPMTSADVLRCNTGCIR
jgi:replicative superfamily II helicase